MGGAFAAGRIAPRLGPRRYRRLTTALTAVSLLAAAPLELRAAGGAAPAIGLDRPLPLLLPLGAAALFGVSDSAIAVLAYSTLARLSTAGGGADGAGTGDGGDSSPEAASARAGGARQLLYSCGFLVGFIAGPYVAGLWQLAFLAALLVCAALTPLPASGSETGMCSERGPCLRGSEDGPAEVAVQGPSIGTS